MGEDFRLNQEFVTTIGIPGQRKKILVNRSINAGTTGDVSEIPESNV